MIKDGIKNNLNFLQNFVFCKKGYLIMKKTKLALLSMLSILCITGCNNTQETGKKDDKTIIDDGKQDDGKQDDGKQDDGKQDDGKQEEQKSDGKFKLTYPSDTSQLSANCKAYVDAMRAQEKANGEDNKYKMDGCNFKPTDNVKIDAKNADGSWVYRDAVDYDDESKRVEQQSQKSDKSKGVKLKFACENGFSAESYKIQVSTDDKFSSDKTIEVTATPNTEVCVKNLFQNTTYYWRVVAGETISTVTNFKTGDYPRWIDAEDLFNVRDAGGFMTSSGKRVKQGLIFRGGEITTKAFASGGGFSQTKHQYTGTAEAKAVFRDVMHIGNELDLRRSGDLSADNNYNRCYFAEKDASGKDDIKWTNVALDSWENFLNNKGNIQKCFEAFAHADEAPVYYHCHGGADRTGTLGLFLLGVLGVSYSDIVIDYELTSYSSIIAPGKGQAADSLRRHYQRGTYDHWNEFIPNVEKTSGWDKSKSLQENIEHFLVSVAQVPQATIDRYKSIMLED